MSERQGDLLLQVRSLGHSEKIGVEGIESGTQ